MSLALGCSTLLLSARRGQDIAPPAICHWIADRRSQNRQHSSAVGTSGGHRAHHLGPQPQIACCNSSPALCRPWMAMLMDHLQISAVTLFMKLAADCPDFAHTELCMSNSHAPGGWMSSVQCLAHRLHIPPWRREPSMSAAAAKRSLKSYRCSVVLPAVVGDLGSATHHCHGFG